MDTIIKKWHLQKPGYKASNTVRVIWLFIIGIKMTCVFKLAIIGCFLWMLSCDAKTVSTIEGPQIRIENHTNQIVTVYYAQENNKIVHQEREQIEPGFSISIIVQEEYFGDGPFSVVYGTQVKTYDVDFNGDKTVLITPEAFINE